MNRWKDSVDRLLQETIGDGDVSHLPGAGKPLKLNNDQLTPVELRSAHKIMADNEVLPDWIGEGKRLDQLERRLRHQINRRAARYLRESRSAADPTVSSNSKDTEKAWIRYVEDFVERVARYNRHALTYNLKVPQGIAHKQILSGEDLISRALHSPP